MSTILDYLTIYTLTMYGNNIKIHYVEYIERFVNVVWKKKFSKIHLELHLFTFQTPDYCVQYVIYYIYNIICTIKQRTLRYL